MNISQYLESPKYTNDLHKVKTFKSETQLKFVENHRNWLQILE